MTAALRLYAGHVMHLRLRPRRHRFRYRVWWLMLDLDRWGEAAEASRLLRVDRPGLLSLRARDHGPRDGSALRPWVDATLRAAGLPRPARVEMLAMPRLLGYAFNPLTTYFGYDAAGRLESLVYQVRNTFGDQIAYALPAGPAADGLHRQAQVKGMFVSPFVPMEQTYRFEVRAPDERLSLRIRQGDAAGELLIATQTGSVRAFSDAALARLLASHPLVTFKVIAGIHWEALRLFLKGVRFLGHPGADAVYRTPGPPSAGGPAAAPGLAAPGFRA
jgi:hypothetical protein